MDLAEILILNLVYIILWFKMYSQYILNHKIKQIIIVWFKMYSEYILNHKFNLFENIPRKSEIVVQDETQLDIFAQQDM